VVALSWNIFHGRDWPPNPALRTLRSKLFRVTEHDATHVGVNRPLDGYFARWLARERWDLALLQEAPPTWLAHLAAASGADGVLALTSRNTLAPLRAIAARWNPDLVGSWEGGSNQLLVRPPWKVEDVELVTLGRVPERRRLLLARLGHPERAPLVAGCLHAQAHDAAKAAEQVLAAAHHAAEWAAAAPLILGGDFNLSPRRSPETFARLARQFGLAPPTAPDAIDHLMARGLDVEEAPRVLPDARRELPWPIEGGTRQVRLSDHAPVVAALRLPA